MHCKVLTAYIYTLVPRNRNLEDNTGITLGGHDGFYTLVLIISKFIVIHHKYTTSNTTKVVIG